MERIGDSDRARAMQARRARILAEARKVIAARGAEALSLRDLARAAGVTVPTIYNLIGGRDDVLVALFSEVLAALDAAICTAHLTDPLAIAEALAVETATIFAADEGYYRASFLALEQVRRSVARPASATNLYRWGDALLAAGVNACVEARLLKGAIPAVALADLVKRSFREALYAWAFGETSLAAFRAGALADLYVTLAADAFDGFKARLTARIETVAATRDDQERAA